ncbi:E3 SUMO-protein ligase PIAS1 isoform X3 [Rhipicephalus sanguineus]|uniref:E3 SUMO-protein ligase PIAS1 isoform X3 n=1 Tax=Rhipicephalus sanguineus TaxID=34632 RepID=UPI0020C3D432|nr:E3 SUMO-protein ligase PIAS1 isoform X3 [Rhipicephalus sanguineus]
MCSQGSSMASRKRSRPGYPPGYFKRQPFYDVLATLLPPTPLNSGRPLPCNVCLRFQFSQHHAKEIFAKEIFAQVHLRLCSDDGLGELVDSYPADLKVKVNDQACALPASIPVKASGGATARVCLPVDIVSACFLYPGVENKLSLSWLRELGRKYFVGVFLVRRQSAATILRELQQKNAASVTHTKELVKKTLQERASDGDDIEVTSLHVSITCPLSKKRMSVPCRALGCEHVHCFDAPSYLQVNEAQPTWMCPVCGRRAEFSSLVVDQLFMQIVEEAPAACVSVVFRKDGSWTPSASPKDDVLAGKASSSARCSPVPSSSSSNEQDGRPNKRRKTKFVDLNADVIDHTEDSGDEAKGHQAGVGLRP